MDLVQNIVMSFLQSNPSHTANSVQSQLKEIHDQYLFPYIFGPLDKLLSNGVNKADLVSLLIMIIVFWVSLRVLNYARRIIMWWVTTAFRLGFWVLILGGAWYVYNVGLEKALQDCGWIWGLLEGFLVDQGTSSKQKKDYGWQRQQVPKRGKSGHR